ncbi:MAG: site-specific DNA-methyltransferase [Proteobacteria bacterium]|nr:site-specific DNA-methyltransferase [Pseudomonadota bacterium]
MSDTEQNLVRVKLTDLTRDPSNARLHDARNLEAIRASLRRFGQQHPLIVDLDNVVVAGNGRVEAMRAEGWTECNVVYTDLGGAERAAFAIADNRTAELAAWEDEVLAQTLASMDDDLTEAAGFIDDELEKLLGKQDEEETGDPAAGDGPGEDLQDKWSTERGQAWDIGPHRLVVGDATDPENWNRLMRGDQADLIFTDPPYGVSYTSDVQGGLANDDLRDDALLDLVGETLKHAAKHSAPTAGWYIWHAMQTRADFEAALTAAGLVEIDTIIWVKPGGGVGLQDYRRAYEPCIYAVKDGESPDFYAGREGTTVWRLGSGTAGERASSLGAGLRILDGNGQELWVAPNPPKTTVRRRRIRLEGDETLRIQPEDPTSNTWEIARDVVTEYQHPTQKPTALAERAIRNSSLPGQIVADPFLGSGSTLLAAEALGRACYGFELDPVFAALILQRASDAGLTPKLAEPDIMG